MKNRTEERPSNAVEKLNVILTSVVLFLGAAIYNKVDSHTDRLAEHDTRISVHETRISVLEKERERQGDIPSQKTTKIYAILPKKFTLE